MRTYAIAVLRSVEPDISDYELDETYQDTWLSIKYPGIGLSRNTVSEHISQLGRTCSRISKFMVMRAGRVNVDHVVVDGTLKSDESKVNTFSDFSRKALKKGTRDISVIYAYNVETGEPICSKAYPGNTIDIAAWGTSSVRTMWIKGLWSQTRDSAIGRRRNRSMTVRTPEEVMDDLSI